MTETLYSITQHNHYVQEYVIFLNLRINTNKAFTFRLYPLHDKENRTYERLNGTQKWVSYLSHLSHIGQVMKHLLSDITRQNMYTLLQTNLPTTCWQNMLCKISTQRVKTPWQFEDLSKDKVPVLGYKEKAKQALRA